MRETIEEIIKNYKKWGKREIDEYNTKIIFIEPLINSLGWNVKDLDVVEREKRVFGGGRVDFSLKLEGKLVMYIEAKAIKESLDDEKFISQAINYANIDGVQWCLLTNGIDYRLYKSDEKGVASSKLMKKISLKKIIDNPYAINELTKELKLLSVSSIKGGRLLEEANVYFIDSKVKKVLEKLKRKPPRKFINIVRDGLNKEYSYKEIKDSILRISGVIKPEGVKKPIVNQVFEEVDYWISSIKADELRTAEEMIQDHVGRYRVYAFGVRTPGRKSIKPGDWICFYATTKGVIAHARVISKPVKKRHPSIRHSEKYPYVFSLDSEKLYLDNPIIIKSVIRKKLGAFQSRDPNRSWGWFVQSTRRITKHDFEILTK